MIRRFLAAGITISMITAACAALAPSQVPAAVSHSYGPEAVPASVIPSGAEKERDSDPPSVFEGDGERFDLESYRSRETLRLSGKRADMPVVSFSELMLARGVEQERRVSSGGKRRIAISVLASAILPGLGELYLYFDSGEKSYLTWFPLFMAVDGYLWYGYKKNYDEGKDFKRQYEEYCDAHWSEERFLDQHPWCDALPSGQCDSWQQYNEECDLQPFFFLYIPKELDREEYYENCGKYDAFCFGWDDWDPAAWDGNYDEQFKELAWTPHRTYYWDLRAESDKYLVRADQHVMLLIVNRVVSMIDAGWLAYKMNKGEKDDGGISLDLEPGLTSTMIGISYRF